MNAEDQYSIWPANRENPLGWKAVGKTGPKAEIQTPFRAQVAARSAAIYGVSRPITMPLPCVKYAFGWPRWATSIWIPFDIRG